jgi:hypothetical protein
MLQVASINHIAMVISVYNAVVRIRNLEPENVSFAYKWIDNIYVELPVLAGEGNKYRIPVVVANPHQLPQWQNCVNGSAGAGKFAQSDAYVRSFKQQSSITIILATMQYAGEWYNNPNIDCLLFGDIPICPVQNCGRLRNFARGTVLYVHDRTMDRNSTRASDTTMKMIKHDIFPRMSKPEYIEVVSIIHYSAIDTELSRMHSMIKAGHDIAIVTDSTVAAATSAAPSQSQSQPQSTLSITNAKRKKKAAVVKKPTTTTPTIKLEPSGDDETAAPKPPTKKKRTTVRKIPKETLPSEHSVNDATTTTTPTHPVSVKAASTCGKRKRQIPTTTITTITANNNNDDTGDMTTPATTTTTKPVKRKRMPKKEAETVSAQQSVSASSSAAAIVP